MHQRNWNLLIKIIICVILFLFILMAILQTPLQKSASKVKLMQYTKDADDDVHHQRRDWHDWPAIHMDYLRKGIGEQGKAATLDNKTDQVLEAALFKQHGLNALLSDVISINRSVADVRDKGCFYKKYLSKLPSVSIVITFHNELLSTFARTLHSIINRTPAELLKEIILVDDFSESEFFKKLEKYVAEHFPEKVLFVRMPARSGLIRARLAGARKMTAEILVILEPHIEVNYNWLPPLLEPIVFDKRTVVCPIIDPIYPQTLEYVPATPPQGGFEWSLTYIETSMLPKDFIDKTALYKNPVMLGGIFAISIDYFWQLGGYDDGLDIWGGEQFELSFKIWMCGGRLLNAPCSRVGHHFRGNLNKGPDAQNKEYLIRNKKRVAEVWMDEYKIFVYARNEDIRDVDAGDLTKQKAFRTKLQCNSFKWFLNEIAVNILREWPPIEPLEYASGAIQSIATPSLCIDTLGGSSPGLYPCAKNLKLPHNNQVFLLRFSRDLRWRTSAECLDIPTYSKNASIILYPCHNQGANQFWYYDRKNKWLMNGPERNYCLDSLPSNKTIFMNICDKDNINMKWNFGNVNETALDNYDLIFRIQSKGKNI